MKVNIWVDTKTTTVKGKAEAENVKESNSQNYYGRAHNEEIPFTQANFEAYQDILNKRNALLSDVKQSNYSI